MTPRSPSREATSRTPGRFRRRGGPTFARRSQRRRTAPPASASPRRNTTIWTTSTKAYLSGIPDGKAKSQGIKAGEQAAATILALRATDGFDTPIQYDCNSVPPQAGEFEPNGGCGTQPVGTNVGQITPFTLRNAGQFAPDGPAPLTSDDYTADFIETRDYGRANSAFRTPEQTDIVYFWSEHTYVQL
jgi:hypothetical protein